MEMSDIEVGMELIIGDRPTRNEPPSWTPNMDAYQQLHVIVVEKRNHIVVKPVSPTPENRFVGSYLWNAKWLNPVDMSKVTFDLND